MSAIIVRGAESVAIEINDSAFAERESAIDESLFIGAVKTSAQQNQAVSSMRRLKMILRTVESSRKDVKAPLLDLGRRIDATAEEFVTQVKTEATRLESLLVGYETEQRKIREEAERQRLAAERAVREAEERKQAELRRQIAEAAEKARQAEIAALRAKNAEAEAEADKMAQAAAAERQAREAQLARERMEAAERAAQAARAVVPAPVRPTGTVIRDSFDFELTDIHALYSSNPSLVSLTPRRAEILAAIKDGNVSIPGIRIFSKTKFGVR